MQGPCRHALALNPVPEIPGQDRRLLARIDSPLVADLADIGPILEQGMEIARPERPAARPDVAIGTPPDLGDDALVLVDLPPTLDCGRELSRVF